MDEVSLELTCPIALDLRRNRTVRSRPMIGQSWDVRAISAFQPIPGYERGSPIEAKADVPCPVDGRLIQIPPKRQHQGGSTPAGCKTSCIWKVATTSS